MRAATTRPAARRRVEVLPAMRGWSLLLESLCIPDDWVWLARAAAKDGPGALAGQRSADVGLLVVHPDNPQCTPQESRSRSPLIGLRPHAELAMAARLSVQSAVPHLRGGYLVLLVGPAGDHRAAASVAARLVTFAPTPDPGSPW